MDRKLKLSLRDQDLMCLAIKNKTFEKVMLYNSSRQAVMPHSC